MNAAEIRLEMTCGACPEQYDAFVGREQVGYLRLRHGRFTVEVPDVAGALVYSADTIGDGVFAEEEREYHLQRAKDAIVAFSMAETLEDQHRDREWLDRRGRRWRWCDINGWVVDNWATLGGHNADGHGPFRVVVQSC